MRVFAVLSACALLAGCGPSREQLIQSAQETCFSYGFDYGTPQHAQCMMQKDQQYAAMQMQRQQNFQAGLANMQRSLQAQEPVRMAPRTCTSRVVFNQVVTDCQ